MGLSTPSQTITSVLVGIALSASPVMAATSSKDTCKALETSDFAGIQDAPTQVMDAGLIAAAGNVPAHCLVEGYVSPQVRFALRLPATTWNGKFLEIGCGGSCGSTKLKQLIEWCGDALRRGYSCIVSDRGHSTSPTGKGNAGSDFLWAYNNLEAEIDSGFRAAHVTALAGKAITQRYYGTAPRFSYFMGCSGGGRQAMVEVQRFPWDFDGVIAIDPSVRFSESALALHWRTLAVTGKDKKPLFTANDASLLHHAALGKCDLDDGVIDGVIGNPPACTFDPGELVCKQEREADCLSLEKVEAARKVYSGPVTSKGEKLFAGGTMPGAEQGPLGFLGSGYNSTDSLRYQNFMPDLGPSWEAEDLDFDRDYRRLGLMGAINDAVNPDLRPFKRAGGKLIMAQGWHDSGSPLPLSTIDYYEAVERTMGGRKATQQFARLFMMPGRAHCGGGPGANAFDYISYLENWVEREQPPDALVGAHIEQSQNSADYIKQPEDPARIKFTRPVYPYPLRAVYTGKGDRNDYRNFKAVEAPVEW